ncbi:hypothetical protein COCSADRAFT_104571, partial [Bipolaris sorokiniana ND90Pr]
FIKLKSMIDQIRIQLEDLYNIDETGCRTGVAVNQYIYTRNQRAIFIPNAKNRELITLVESINAASDVSEPMVT